VIGELPEQVPYLEWRHSEYRESAGCVTCHMPEVDEPMPITNTWGQPRERLSRHTFLGGNVFMMRALNRFRADLRTGASVRELDAAATATTSHLASASARLSVAGPSLSGGLLAAQVVIGNVAGHKLPTAYPSRRAWLHVRVLDRDGVLVFESGRPEADARIAGNDNDEDGTRFEPHYDEISRPDQVQIYENIMVDAASRVTTGLLSAVAYAKDNRLLPRGFDKGSAPPEVRVHGRAARDEDFGAGGDRIRYRIDVDPSRAPFRFEAELVYQSIGYRWAANLRGVDAPETRRFTRYYDALAKSSAIVLARASATVP
jgi:hypothetical protein